MDDVKGKVLVRDYPDFAGYYIYKGYTEAWKEAGYEVVRWKNLNPEEVEGSIIMMTDGDIKDYDKLHHKILSKAKKIFLFVSPNKFPEPWGEHSNFVTPVASNKKHVEMISSLENVEFWTFLNVDKNPEYWSDWSSTGKKIHYVPLAYDKITYGRYKLIDSKIDYDVCYIGSWANNGFNSKQKIIKSIFKEFMKSDLECGFFINQNLSMEQEAKILTNSSVSLNIHDDYQHTLGLDTNERTFKSLGINGNLVSDYVEEINELGFSEFVKMSDDPKEIVKLVEERVKYSGHDKKKARKHIKKNHTYSQRVEYFENLI